jgi:hypothetical protein
MGAAPHEVALQTTPPPPAILNEGGGWGAAPCPAHDVMICPCPSLETGCQGREPKVIFDKEHVSGNGGRGPQAAVSSQYPM